MRIPKLFLSLLMLCLVTCSAIAQPVAAPVEPQQNNQQLRGREAEPVLREIFVPYEDLKVILASNVERVFMSRKEYESLLEKADIKPGTLPPQNTALRAASYKLTVHGDHAVIDATLSVESLAAGIQILPLSIAGVSIHSAMIGDKAVGLVRGPQNSTGVVLEQPGVYELKMQFELAVNHSAAQQSLSFALPNTAATTLALDVPGNIELKSGASVLSRSINEEDNITSFELLPRDGQFNLVMSLNNKQLQSEQVVQARNVIVTELAEAFERLHVSSSMKVLQGAVEKFEFQLPDGFEVTKVESDLLARWSVSDAPSQRVLTVELTETTTTDQLINITAIKINPTYEDWMFPTLQPIGTISSSSVLGVLTEQTLTIHSLRPQGLLPLDNLVLEEALPESIYVTETGAPPVNLVSTFYAAQSGFSLAADIAQPDARFSVQSNLLLTVEPTRYHLQGAFSLLPEVDDLFSARIAIADDWQVIGVTDQTGAAVNYHVSTTDDGEQFIHARFNTRIVAGETGVITIQATRTPTGWLAFEKEFATSFPRFAVDGAFRDIGLLAVRALPGYEEVYQIRGAELDGVTTVSNSEKEKFGLGSIQTQLVYRYEQTDYSAGISIERIKPIYSARTSSFFNIQPGQVHCHYELSFELQRGRTDEFEFVLPAFTPNDVRVTGVNGPAVKRFEKRDSDDNRIWTVELSDLAVGEVVLSAQFDLPRSEVEEHGLPVVEAIGVSYQNGVLSLEASPELQVTTTTDADRVDVGELAALSYAVGQRRIGAYGFVGTPPELTIAVEEPEKFTLPTIVVDQCSITSYLSSKGKVQSVAELALAARTDYVLVALPKGAKLWGVTVQNQPVRPQVMGEAKGNKFLVDLSKLSPVKVMDEYGYPAADLALVYESNQTMTHKGDLNLVSPKLYRFNRQKSDTVDETLRIPVSKTNWRVVVPSSYGIVGAGQPFEKRSNHYYMTEFKGWLRPRLEVPGALVVAGGGVHSTLGASAQTADSVAMTVRSVEEHDYDGAPMDGGAEYEMFEDGETSAEGAEEFMSGAAPQAAMDAAEKEMSDPFDAPASEPAAPPSVNAPEPTEQPIAEEKNEEIPQNAQGVAPKSSEVPDMAVPEDEADSDDLAVVDRSWAMSGKRSLKIHLNGNLDSEESLIIYEFKNLSTDAEITGTLIHKSTVTITGWAFGLVVFALGLFLCGKQRSTQLRFVLGVELAMLALYFFGIMPALEDAWIVVALMTLVLIPIYLFNNVYRESLANLTRRLARKATAALLITAVCLGYADSAVFAQANDPAELTPVSVPDSAVIVPYNPDQLPTNTPEQQLLVPLAKYTQLWQRAFPDKPLPHEVAPVSHAIAQAAYTTVLIDGDFLAINGSIDIDVFTTDEISIPIALQGGVLESALLDGKTASVEIRETRIPVPQQQAQQQQAIVPNAPAQQVEIPLLYMHVSGKGRHRLELRIRARLEQQGGWRIADLQLPTGPAAAMTFSVPSANTEIRWQGINGKSEYVSQADNESVVSGTSGDGRVQFRWRSGFSQTRVDRDLTANSSVMVDVQEDGTYIDWDVVFNFRSAQRDIFRLLVPLDYRVESVKGGNVRGWQVRTVNERQELSVELLEAATQTATLKIRLVKHENLATGETIKLSIPSIVVPDAVLHQGAVTVRRSPILDLVPTTANGIVREDVPESASSVQPEAQDRVGPLGLEPVQAYRFSSTGFELELEAALIKQRVTARLQSVLRVSQQDITLETQVQYYVTGRPIHQARILVPADLIIRLVHAPGIVDWAEVPYDLNGKQVKLVTILFGAGVSRYLNVVIDGRLERELSEEQTSSVPHLSALDVAQQTGETVLMTDPTHTIKLLNVQNGSELNMASMFGWLQREQRRFARVALRFSNNDYSATFKVERQPSQIRAISYSNVKLTSQAIEETILIEFMVINAGTKSIQFELPAWMRDARIKSQYLRDVTVSDIEGKPDWVNVDIELEDEVLGQLRIIVEHDRELKSDQKPPVPVIKTGIVDGQFVALESSGFELEVSEVNGFEEIDRQQNEEWTRIQRYLPGNIHMAFKVLGQPEDAKLTYSTRQRQVIDKDDVHILLSETFFYVDRHGAYRCKVVLHVDNQKEQFLTVQMPSDSVLWSVTVAGQPVKPLKSDGDTASPQTMRVPLVRTELGDDAIMIQLIYAGNMPALSNNWATVTDFPFVATPDRVPNKNHISVNLPRTYSWDPDTDGTLEQVDESFQYREVESIWRQRNSALFNKVKQSKNVNDKIRLQLNFENQRITNGYVEGREIQKQIDEIKNDVSDYLEQSEAVDDNRRYLNDGFLEQDNEISRNAVNQLGNNFDMPQALPTPMKDAADTRVQNSKQWLRSNGLQQAAEAGSKTEGNPQSRVQQFNKGKLNYYNSNNSQSIESLDLQLEEEQGEMPDQSNLKQNRQQRQAQQYLQQQQELQKNNNFMPQFRGKTGTPDRFGDEMNLQGGLQQDSAPTNGSGFARPGGGGRPNRSEQMMGGGDMAQSADGGGNQAGLGGMGGGMGGGGGFGAGGMPAGGEGGQAGMAYGNDASGEVGGLYEGFDSGQGRVSLAIDLGLNPGDYQTYHFSAPGDDLSLTVTGVENEFSDKLEVLGIGLAVLAGIVLLYFVLIVVNRVAWLTIVGGAVATIVGFGAFVKLFLPVYAALLFAGGVMWLYCGLIRRRQVRCQAS